MEHCEYQKNPEHLLEPKTAQPGVLSFRSEEFFRGKREITIEHNSQRYRLHITRAGKLILTK